MLGRLAWGCRQRRLDTSTPGVDVPPSDCHHCHRRQRQGGRQSTCSPLGSTAPRWHHVRHPRGRHHVRSTRAGRACLPAAFCHRSPMEPSCPRDNRRSVPHPRPRSSHLPPRAYSRIIPHQARAMPSSRRGEQSRRMSFGSPGQLAAGGRARSIARGQNQRYQVPDDAADRLDRGSILYAAR